MTKDLSQPINHRFRDTHAVVTRGEPCPLGAAAGLDPAALITTRAVIDHIAAVRESSPVSVTLNPPIETLAANALFEVAGQAYASCAGADTLFIDLAHPDKPVYGLPADGLAARLLECGERGDVSDVATCWALVDDTGRHPRELAQVDELAMLALERPDVADIFEHAQAFTDCLRDVPTAITAPRLSLVEVESGRLLATIVDCDEVVAGISREGVVTMRSSWFAHSQLVAPAELPATIRAALGRWRAVAA